MERSEFREAIYELAFGDDAINKKFTEEEVIEKIKEFSNLALTRDDVVLVEFGTEDTEAEVFRTVDDAEEYFVNELDYMTSEQFDNLKERGTFTDHTGIRAVMYRDYKVNNYN